MSLVTPVEVVPADRLGRVHFVGIGGAGMSGIARIMLGRGIPVSGSDAKDSDLLADLRELGATTYVGHAAEHVGDASTVVVSTAIRETNPELAAARERGLLVLHRAAALASLMDGRRSVAVAGTHGKTTTTSMLTVALQHAGADPSYCIGGQLVTTGLGAADGSGDLFVAEADESDGSFLMFAPKAAIVTNIEADHLDNYADFAMVKETFARFVERIQPGGLLVVCADDPVARATGEEGTRRGLTVRTYGEAEDADYRTEGFTPRGLGSTFTVGERTLELSVPGRHNALNATAAYATAVELGVSADAVADGLAGFTGARRRLEPKGEVGGVKVFDSYAHHPTELAADLRATRDYVGELGGGRIVAVFQPHLFSRTKFFAAEFGAALGLADEVIVMDVFPAREDPIPGVTGELVAKAVPHGRVTYEADGNAVAGRVAAIAAPGDVIITMGAGDVTMLGPKILGLLGT
ncbi:UDP-N-acetylmuramate--L-alanine ligase [Actinoallomurus bryophytorum]|uniref:UDP-N-acetylmuramate--L-alanine ligase n=1 Tax=Actinoallomurus bryophytorum TaxID=1490222 RepID=A0A543CBU4_9ACTN|nr:UDP-N-acetylmuramate--L-alanine ligase [Actinoallomurus bryophytorum]TQL94539.1 UDP-N-acetylmuramate--L-alanine ligase [Actinoallomurus bryophytorum]